MTCEWDGAAGNMEHCNTLGEKGESSQKHVEPIEVDAEIEEAGELAVNWVDIMKEK